MLLWRDLVDIAVVSIVIYRLLIMLRGTRAIQVLLGLLAVFAVYLTSQWFDLMTLNWVLNHFFTYMVLIFIILFQEEIRTALATVGRRSLFGQRSGDHTINTLDEVLRAAYALRERKLGCLIVLQRRDRLGQYRKTGTELDALVSRELLVGLFLHDNPLHDGAVLIRDFRIEAAGCFLPLAMEDDLPRNFGTRHRAALGLAKVSDAVVVVVSEERREVSIVVGNRLLKKLPVEEARHILLDAFGLVDRSKVPAFVQAAGGENK